MFVTHGGDRFQIEKKTHLSPAEESNWFNQSPDSSDPVITISHSLDSLKYSQHSPDSGVPSRETYVIQRVKHTYVYSCWVSFRTF